MELENNPQAPVQEGGKVRVKPRKRARSQIFFFGNPPKPRHIHIAENTKGPATASAIAMRLKSNATMKAPENSPHISERTIGITTIVDARSLGDPDDPLASICGSSSGRSLIDFKLQPPT